MMKFKKSNQMKMRKKKISKRKRKS